MTKSAMLAVKFIFLVLIFILGMVQREAFETHNTLAVFSTLTAFVSVMGWSYCVTKSK